MAAGGHRQSFSSAVWAKLRAGATKAIPQGFRVRHEGLPQVILSNALLNGWDGAFLQPPTILVTSDGAEWTLSITGPGTTDLQVIFAGKALTFDTTPAATIALTAGTDAAFQDNFIYLTESGGVITMGVSTVSFPEGTAHAHIATVSLQSAASGQTDGPLRVHAWIDHISGTLEGHIIHLAEKSRTQADWKSGVAASMAVTAPDAYFAVTAGTVYQLHLYTFPARDMESGDKLYLVNDPGRNIADGITTLDDITQDAVGGGINNKYISITVFGVVSETEVDCKIYGLLPVGSYSTGQKAVDDVSKFSVYDMPSSFGGTAFLIARITVLAKNSGTWAEFDIEDLRGDSPSTSPGGGAGVTAHGDLSGLPNDDHPQYPLKTLWNVNSVLVAVSDDTPVVQAVAASEFVGRKATGDVGAMSAAEARTVLGLDLEGVIKAWAFFDGRVATLGLNDSFNIASLTRIAAGQYRLTFSTAMASINYAVVGMGNWFVPAFTFPAWSTNTTAAYAEVVFGDTNRVNLDGAAYSIMVLGDQ